jgi:hypothetical protein
MLRNPQPHATFGVDACSRSTKNYNIPMRPRYIIIALLIFIAALACAEANKRLILKDGSYQSVTKYEKKGDRVRYYSAERYDWEDIPTELIDWTATEKYNHELEQNVAHSAEQVDKEVASEKEEEAARTPEVAPKLRLPDGGGVYVVDYFQSTPELVELTQQTSEINIDRKGNILRQTVNPLASSKQKIEVTGPHSKVQVHVARPSVYINVDDTNPGNSANPDKTDDALLMPPPKPERYRFLRMQVGKDSRVVGNLKVKFTGKMEQEQSFIPTKGEPISGGWIKITPEQDLAPGEYAVVEMLGQKEFNLYVWDVGINPAAPENPTAWKPEVARQQAPKDQSSESPVLNKRPKQD